MLTSKFHAVMPGDLASLVNADDVELVSAFLTAHTDVVFPDATLPSHFRQSGYQTLILLLKLLRSRVDLREEECLIDCLATLKCYAFSGP
ncbi:hypothetical protein RIF29_41056 [Crotalaria pallida]|uniref:Uncharacterized protein n=1 Tax=Crotalaria pallida TaxID=3830 RepID=A0AAN9HR92_CROPI